MKIFRARLIILEVMAVAGILFFAQQALADVCIVNQGQPNQSCGLASDPEQSSDDFARLCANLGTTPGNASPVVMNGYASCGAWANRNTSPLRLPPISGSTGGSGAVDAGADENNPLKSLKGDIQQLDKFNVEGKTQPLPIIIGKMIQKVMSVIGALALVLFIYGGIVWMLAAGNSEREKKGLDTLFWGGLGIAVIFASYALVDYIFKAFQ